MRDAAPLRAGDSAYTLTQIGGRYLLYYAMRLFFENAGMACYVVSAGEYGSETEPTRAS